jgi:hypothetical protein
MEIEEDKTGEMEVQENQTDEMDVQEDEKIFDSPINKRVF